MTAHEILERRKAAPLPEVDLPCGQKVVLREDGYVEWRGSGFIDPVGILRLRDFLNELYPPEQK